MKNKWSLKKEVNHKGVKRLERNGRNFEVAETERGEEEERMKRMGGVEGTKSQAACQGLFHLCSPGLSELPPSLLSLMSSMKGPLRRNGGHDSGFKL